MKPEKTPIRTSFIICCFLVCTTIITGQTYSFRNYGAESSIPNGFVYTLNQSNDGFLWVGTASGLYRFDGFNFYQVPFPDTVVVRNPTTSHKDRNGRLWFGFNDGTVFCSNGNTLIKVPLPETTKSIVSILENSEGQIWIVPQGEAVFRVNPLDPGELSRYSFPSDQTLSSAAFSSSGELLAGTQLNILVCKTEADTITVKSTIEGFNYSNVTSIFPYADGNRFIIGTSGNGLFRLKISLTGNSLSRFSGDKGLESLSVQSITGDSDNNLWVATFGSGVIQLTTTADMEGIKSMRIFNSSSGLAQNEVKTVFEDAEGNFWMGFYGEGISMLTSYAFSHFLPGKTEIENNIIYVKNLGGKFILGTPAGFHLFDTGSGKSESFTDLKRQAGNSEINCYFLDKDENLWIGTAGNGLFVRNSNGEVRKFFRSGDTGSDDIKDIEADEKYIWIATINGLLVIDRKTGNEVQRFDMNNGLPHNSINKIFTDREGNICVATETDQLFRINRDFKLSHGESSMYGSTRNIVLSICQDNEGAIWTATKGNGIFKFENDSVFAITRLNDLMSNYCYSILADSENEIWIGHDKGFSRFNINTGVMKIFGTDLVKGGMCNSGAMFESSDKKIFIGTTEGLVIYDREKDKKLAMAPANNINYITINNDRYEYGSSIKRPYSRKSLVKINFTGINFSSPEKVFYSTYLENYDISWTKMNNQREVTYSLGDGKFKFNLISVDEDGHTQETPSSFELIINHPFWKTWWFYLSSVAAIVALVILIIKQREKAQKKLQKYLEEELDARTAVIRHQKTEIELQNIEITDSINYAKRIQTSILPDINKLKEAFKDAYILFHPRDIVSGDFYWFDKLDEDRFMIVCADSTGHGVPGAFMSMIGSTLLQDIVTRQGITKPSVILKMLDRQIFSTLNQNAELGVANDGMDIVICEINVKTRHVVFASAMRPIIIVLSGEPFYIRGNRLSVGGESIFEKYFDDQEYYLNEGDTIYFFSDGLPDQFGGTDGKKLKVARLKRLIEEMSKLTMADQDEAMSKFFVDWKGSYDQVDDVIFMAVRV